LHRQYRHGPIRRPIGECQWSSNKSCIDRHSTLERYPSQDGTRCVHILRESNAHSLFNNFQGTFQIPCCWHRPAFILVFMVFPNGSTKIKGRRPVVAFQRVWYSPKLLHKNVWSLRNTNNIVNIDKDIFVVWLTIGLHHWLQPNVRICMTRQVTKVSQYLSKVSAPQSTSGFQTIKGHKQFSRIVLWIRPLQPSIRFWQWVHVNTHFQCCTSWCQDQGVQQRGMQYGCFHVKWPKFKSTSTVDPFNGHRQQTGPCEWNPFWYRKSSGVEYVCVWEEEEIHHQGCQTRPEHWPSPFQLQFTTDCVLQGGQSQVPQEKFWVKVIRICNHGGLVVAALF